MEANKVLPAITASPTWTPTRRMRPDTGAEIVKMSFTRVRPSPLMVTSIGARLTKARSTGTGVGVNAQNKIITNKVLTMRPRAILLDFDEAIPYLLFSSFQCFD